MMSLLVGDIVLHHPHEVRYRYGGMYLYEHVQMVFHAVDAMEHTLLFLADAPYVGV